MSQDGVEIFTNSSASHHELRKADSRVNLIRSATSKVPVQRVTSICDLTNESGADFGPQNVTIIPA